jgi:DUF4097 and DUF4098 domain-containing protein YvlB
MRFLIPTLLIATAVAASALTEENMNENRAAKSGGKLIVEVDFGTIDIAAGDQDKVIVNAHREVTASSKEKEKELIDSAPITVTTEGDSVIVRARRGKNSTVWDRLWNGANTRTDARYTIHVPPAFNLELNTGGGAIIATDVAGTVNAKTSGGELKFNRLCGPLDGQSNGGRIRVTACDGSIDIKTHGGQIEAEEGSGSLRLHTDGGFISVSHFDGDADVQSNGGKLLLKDVRGNISAHTAAGLIAATLPSPVAGNVKLETFAGAIEVFTPVDAGLSVDAKTSLGVVTSELPVTGTRIQRQVLQGTINGGGNSLFLRSGVGTISIKSATSELARR